MSETSLPAPIDEAIDRLAPLAEPARRRVFAFVAAAAAPVTREEAATGAGLSVALTTFHLEKLLEAGLLEASFATPTDSGGGRRRRGRPAKRYRPAPADISLSFPVRNYRLAAELLAAALPRDVAATSLGEAARQRGRAIGQTIGGSTERLVDILSHEGYVPRTTRGRIEFGNCPFDGLTRVHGDLMCPANHALLEGILEAAGVAMEVRLEPGEGRCCVVLEPASELANPES